MGRLLARVGLARGTYYHQSDAMNRPDRDEGLLPLVRDVSGERPVPLRVPTGVARTEKHGYCRVSEARHAADDGERVETAVQELQALQLV